MHELSSMYRVPLREALVHGHPSPTQSTQCCNSWEGRESGREGYRKIYHLKLLNTTACHGQGRIMALQGPRLKYFAGPHNTYSTKPKDPLIHCSSIYLSNSKIEKNDSVEGSKLSSSSFEFEFELARTFCR